MTRRPGTWRSGRVPAASALLLLALAAGGCRAAVPRPNVVLITIDTLRADHLGCYGYDRATSPHIDALSRQSTLFERAYTTLPRTTQSVASILTGRYPKTHGARGLFSRLPEVNRTLAEVYREAGYDTAAVVSNTFLRPGQGFEQGFDRYDNPPERWDADSAEDVTTAARDWLDRRSDARPFFLWVHYLDPHWRYEPGARWVGAFDPGYTGPFTLYQDLDAGRITKGQAIFESRLAPRDEAHVVALYDGEIARTDEAVGALLARLDRVRGPLITLLTADHGESLGEHGYHFAHGEYLYEQGLRVPLMLRAPGLVEAGRRTDALVLNVDVAPTLLALCGIDRLQGAEGRPALAPRGAADAAGGAAAGASGPPTGGVAAFVPAPGRPFLYAESDFQLIHPENPRYFVPGPAGRWTAAGDGRYKLIHIPRRGGEILELYDLAADPGETRNLADDPALAEVRARLLREVKGYADYGAGPPASGPRPPGVDLDSLSPEDRARLRSLGYIN